MKRKPIIIAASAIAAFLLTVGAAANAVGPYFGMWLLPPSTEKYGKVAVGIMEQQGLYASGEKWEAAKAAAEEKMKSAGSIEELYPSLEELIKQAGGKHSRFIRPDEVKEYESIPAQMPEITEEEGGVIRIRLPEFSGTKEEASAYADPVVDYLDTHRDINGVIIDLRGNNGGDMAPMIGAVSPLLPDGDLMYFSGPKISVPVKLSNGTLKAGGGIKVRDVKCDTKPVALLTDEKTASSGEATLLCFRGLDNTRTFGAPTAGYASANILISMYDHAELMLTVSEDKARTGELFCDDPIAPDVTTDTPLEDALEWIAGYNK